MATIKTTVRVRIKENQRPIPGVEVRLFDRDDRSQDDFLGSAKTNASGHATVRFDERLFADRLGRFDDPRSPFDFDRDPELYAVLLNSKGEEVFSGRAQARPGRNSPLLRIELPQQVALAGQLFGVKPSASINAKGMAWRDVWLKKLRRDDRRPPEDLCLTHLILDAIANVESPQDPLQQRASAAIKKSVPSAVLGQVKAHAAETRDFVEKTAKDFHDHQGVRALKPLMDGGCSSMDDLKKMVDRWLQPGGRLGQLTKALNAGDPPPDVTLGQPAPGRPFASVFSQWNKDCEDAYRNHLTLPTPEAQAQMDAYYPDGIDLIAMPRVNRIDVWSNPFQKYLRVGHLSTKRLEITTLDGRDGWVDGELNMNVPLDDSQCLVLREDPAAPGSQILAVDVEPGQDVMLRGSGFMADKARIVATRALWSGPNEGADSSGRLVPSAMESSAAGLDGVEVEVHGAQTHQPDDTAASFIGDGVVFTWPANLDQPGLYKVQLDFGPVPNGLVVDASQDPNTCEVSLRVPAQLRTQEFWFTVLPPLHNRQVVFNAERLTCVDEKDPEALLLIPYFDDVLFETIGSVHQLVLDPSTPQNSTADSIDETVEFGNAAFWDDGDSWLPGFQMAPSGSSTHVDLRQDMFAVFGLSAVEVQGLVDDLIIAGLITAVVVVAIVVIAIIAAIIVAIVVGTFGLGAAALGGGLTAVGAIAAAVIAPTIPAVFGPLTAFLATMGNAEPLAMAVTGYSGAELSYRFASNRWQRALWIHPRPEQPGGTLSTVSSLESSPGGLTESFTSTNPQANSIYRIDLTINE